MTRFFLKPQQIHNNNITFDKSQSKKIKKVLRMRVGEYVEAIDGKGWIYKSQIEKITNDFTIAKIIGQELTKNTSNIILVQALPKSLKLEFILQKCTELNVDKFVLFESEFSQIDASRISEEKVKRWRKIVQVAAEQCKRTFVPEIELFTGSLVELVEVLQNDKNQSLCYLDKHGKAVKDVRLTEKQLSNISFIVGPEGGFSPKEISLFVQKGIEPINISKNILRSETAGMAFLAQLEAK